MSLVHIKVENECDFLKPIKVDVQVRAVYKSDQCILETALLPIVCIEVDFLYLY